MDFLVDIAILIGVLGASDIGLSLAKRKKPVSPMVSAIREKRRVLERNREEWVSSAARIHNVKSLEEQQRISISHTRHLEQVDKDLLALADEEAAMSHAEEDEK